MHQAEELLKPPPSTSILSGRRFAQINADKDIRLGIRNRPWLYSYPENLRPSASYELNQLSHGNDLDSRPFEPLPDRLGDLDRAGGISVNHDRLTAAFDILPIIGSHFPFPDHPQYAIRAFLWVSDDRPG